MPDLTERKTAALTALRDATRDVARSLYDDGPHTYVAAVASLLSGAMTVNTNHVYDRALAIGQFTGVEVMLKAMSRDPWSKFVQDVAGCAKKLLIEINESNVAKEERCVALLREEAQKLCNLPVSRRLDNAFGAFIIVREDHGRALAIYRDVEEVVLEPMLRARGALSDEQINERIRCYVAGESAGTRRGAEEIRTGLRLLLNVAAADHRHGGE